MSIGQRVCRGLLWAAFVGFAGCAQLTGVYMGSYLDDRNLQASVGQYFLAEKAGELARVRAIVDDGIIYLTGVGDVEEHKVRGETGVSRAGHARGFQSFGSHATKVE